MKKAKKFLVAMAVTVSAFSGGVTQAQELVGLLPKLLNEHNLIKAAEASRNGARYLESASKGQWLPRLDLVANAGQERVDKVDDSVTDESRNYEALRLSQLLTDFGATSGQIERASLVSTQSITNLESVRQDVLLRGITVYLDIVMAREKLGYARQSEDNIKAQTGMEETLVSKGAGLSSDILQTKSQLARARALRVSAEGELAQAVNQFKAVYGFAPSEEELKTYQLPADPAVNLPSGLDAMVKRALENNPEIKVAALDNEIAVKEEKISQARYLPKIELFAQANRRDNDLGVEGVRTERSFGAELTCNLFRGGSDRESLRAAQEKEVAARGRYEDLRRVVESKVRNAWQDMQTSGEKHKYLQNQAEIVGEFLELARKERKLGTRSLIDVLTGEVDHINAVSQAVTSEIETLLATYNLYYAMGDLSADVVKAR